MKEQVEIYEILKCFHEISGFRVTIHDTEFHEISCYPEQLSPFCARLQQDSCVHRDCLRNDAAAFRQVQQSGEPFVYHCKRGLIEAVAPIYQYGILSGYLMIGQVCADTAEARRQLQITACNILQNETLAAELARTVSSIPESKMNAYLGLMSVIAEYITQTARLYNCNHSLPELVLEYIHKNLSEKLSLDLLANRFRCSRSTLTKSFRAVYGVSITDYITETRLKQAEQLLRTSNQSIKEIAAAVGFYDQNYFSRQFSARYGQSPTAYRNS